MDEADLAPMLSAPGHGEDSAERAGVAISRSPSKLPSSVSEAPRLESDPFPMWKTIIVALPQFSMSSITMLLSIHLLNFFLRLGAPTATLTLVITIARSIDLLSDPAVGWATDGNVFRCCGPCRFPKGVRRKPFMLLGTPLYDIFIVLLLGTPFDFTGNGWAISYGVFNILLYLADTTAHVPYNALLPSLSQDPKQRETIFSIARVFNSLGVMFAALAPVPLGILLKSDGCIVDKCAACPFQIPSNSSLADVCPAIQQGLPLSPGCACLQGCDGECSLLGERAGFRIMGFVFAGWHLITMILVIMFIEEPKEKEIGLTGGLPCCYTADGRRRAAEAETRKRRAVKGGPAARGAVSGASAKVHASASEDDTSIKRPNPLRPRPEGSTDDGGSSPAALVRASDSAAAMPPAAKGSSASDEEEEEEELMEPIVSSINKTFRNKAFRSLIIPWLLDMASVSLLGSMLTLYVTYAVRPTDPTVVPECAGDGVREAFFVTSAIWCSNDSVWLGMGLLALMIGQLTFVPVWRLISNPFGTRNTWLMFNLCAAVTTGLFIFGGVGTPRLTVILSLVNGIPMAAMFLNDAIVSQVIDYDANLQGGERAEARFMLFQSFIPKVISIPASVLPLSALSAIGFVEPINGVAQRQPAIVVNYVQAVFFGVPTVLSLLSFWYKLSFPIRHDEQLDRIAYNNAVLTGEAEGPHADKHWLRDPLDPSLATRTSRSAPVCAGLFRCCAGGDGGLSAAEKEAKLGRARAADERARKFAKVRTAVARMSAAGSLRQSTRASFPEGGGVEMTALRSRKGLPRGDTVGAVVDYTGRSESDDADGSRDVRVGVAQRPPSPAADGGGNWVLPTGRSHSPAAELAAASEATPSEVSGPAGAPAVGMTRRVSLSEEDRLRAEQMRARQEHERAVAAGGAGKAPAGAAPAGGISAWIPAVGGSGADVPRLSVYERVSLTTDDRKAFFVFDHFSLQELGLWSRFGRAFLDTQVRQRRRTLAVVLFFLAFAAVAQVGTGMINSARLSWVPTLTMLSFGLTMGLLVMTHFKVRACTDLRLPICRAEGRFEKWTKFNAMALQLDCLELELVPTTPAAGAAASTA